VHLAGCKSLSGKGYGNIDFLQKVHRQRQARDPIDAIAYHYIIVNGNGLGMGEIASDWRQSYNLWGAHVSISNLDHNFRGIGICLIGNFENGEVPLAQYQALVKLTKRLMKKYSISPGNVNGHGMIAGESTKCSGKHFPIMKFKHDIS
jgi:N-acetyl-anhydromuramyl-L-alanine amidase AmpD